MHLYHKNACYFFLIDKARGEGYRTSKCRFRFQAPRVVSLVLRCNVQGIMLLTLRGNSANLEHHVSIPNTRATNQHRFYPLHLEEKYKRAVAPGGSVSEGVDGEHAEYGDILRTETPGRPDVGEANRVVLR